MKFIKFLIIVIVLALIAGFAIGQLVPEIDWTASVAVERPLDATWDEFHDIDRITEWVSGLESMELIEGEVGAEGSRYKMVFVENDETLDVFETVTVVVPNERFAFESTMTGPMGTMDMECEVLFSADGDTTTITSHCKSRGDSFLMKAMMPLMKGTIADRQQADLDAFKAMAEAG